jgi:hypothetical protein
MTLPQVAVDECSTTVRRPFVEAGGRSRCLAGGSRQSIPMLKEIDELYLNNPYYLVPDGEVGQPARESGLHVS